MGCGGSTEYNQLTENDTQPIEKGTTESVPVGSTPVSVQAVGTTESVPAAGTTESVPVVGTTESVAVIQKPEMDAALDYNEIVLREDETWRGCHVDYDRLQSEPFKSGYHWWDVLDMISNKNIQEVQPQMKRRGWKTIRLFVSSTFKDMQSEREFLVKRVFPELRIWCEERMLRLIDIDLRWGVPKNSDTRETLLTCLSEIDRCYEENEFPYFLNILSERYGWVPTLDEIPDDIVEKYKWLPQLSVTAMEITTGGYWAHNPNALFLFRDSSFLNGVTDKSILKAYQDSGPDIDSLNVLKGKLRDMFPQRVFDYSVNVDGKDGKLLKLSGFEDFGKRVTDHFKSVIDKQYPTDSIGEELSSREIQKLEHEAYMVQRSQILYGRSGVLKQIQDYLQNENEKPTPLVLVGKPGAGKSAIMAVIAKGCAADSSCSTFYHFVGATPGSTDLIRLLTRMWGDLLPGENAPTDVTELKRSMTTVLDNVGVEVQSNKQKRAIILIDALNQLDDEGDAHSLTWLPRELPTNVRVIVSTLEGACLDALRTSEITLTEVEVDPLGVEHRKQVVNGIFKEYNKKLDDAQQDSLVSKEDAGRPLYLSVACEELRVFGKFRELDQKIASLSPDITGLLTQVIHRIVKENGGDLVIATLCLIETSRFGLLETELLELLASSSAIHKEDKNTSDSAVGERLPMVKWAMVYIGLRQFLRPSGGSGEGRLDFHHRTISKAVRALYLHDTHVKISWHKRLANYFEKSPDVERKAEELPYHLETIGDKGRMKSALLERPIFERLYGEDRKTQLFGYWRFAGGYKLAATESVQELDKYIQKNNIESLEDIVKLIAKTIWFIIDLGEYDTAEELLEKTIERVKTQDGESSVLLCDLLNAIVYLYFIQAIKVVYNSSPVYQKCSRKGSTFATQSEKLHRQHLGSNDLRLAKVLSTCGYFNGGRLIEEAQEIYERHKYREGIAECLYQLGEKDQYNSNMELPKAIFQKSLSLCKSVFGYYSSKTARCYQLYGQLYWNRYSGQSELMVTALGMYQHELAILEALLGATHPTTVRSREDVIIILQTLERDPEADELLKQQPEDREV